MQKITLAMASAMLLFLLSCKKSGLSEEAASPPGDDIPALQRSVAQALGTTDENVVYNPVEKQFVVENDGYVTLDDARLRFGKSNGTPRNGANSTSQVAHYFLVNPEKVDAIRIYIDGSVPSSWKRAIEKAITNWNSTGSMVRMERVYSTSKATTKVTTTYSNSATIASAAYPNYYGNIGSRLTINTYHNYLTGAKKQFAMTHELGHIIGFSHTNSSSGEWIEGTPNKDSESVMNSVCTSWDGFSDYDILAVNTIYPQW